MFANFADRTIYALYRDRNASKRYLEKEGMLFMEIKKDSYIKIHLYENLISHIGSNSSLNNRRLTYL